MGLSLSLLLSSPKETLKHRLFGLMENEETVIVSSISFEGNTLRKVSFKKRDSENTTSNSDEVVMIEESLSFKKLKVETTVSFKNLVLDSKSSYSKGGDELIIHKPNLENSLPEPAVLFSPRPASELDAAALKVQKVYKSYRTRRNLADCAVVVEELWWKALDFAALKRSSVSFFNNRKPESAVSRWARARTRAAKVGKGLCKNEKAQKLALRHWLEAIDPRHRYGHNLHMYYNVWFASQSSQPFFYWLDVGDGKEVNLDKCPRTDLQHQCIIYLGPKERDAYEVIVDSGKLVYRQSGLLVDTVEGSKWIFVLSPSRNLYIGQKKKGMFQHSSFLAGAATTASGRLVAHHGVLEAIWPYSGHYLPTKENFMEFISFLEEHHVNLSNVKRFAIDDDVAPTKGTIDEEVKSESTENIPIPSDANIPTVDHHHDEDNIVFELGKRPSLKWTSGTGPRIGCVREYPPKLQFQALEQLNLSPRIKPPSCCPIPSPRPSPKIHLSPSLANMGLHSPTLLQVSTTKLGF